MSMRPDEATTELRQRLDAALDAPGSGDDGALLEDVLVVVQEALAADRLDDVVPLAPRAEALATTTGRWRRATSFRVANAEIERLQGHVETATSWYRSALTAAAEVASGDVEPTVLYCHSQLAALASSLTERAAVLADMLAEAERRGSADAAWPTALGLATTYLEAGAVAEARYFAQVASARLDSTAGRPLRTSTRPADVAELYAELARRSLFDDEEPPRALEEATTALRYDPVHPAALRVQALCLSAAGRYEEAASAWEAHLTSTPDDPGGWANLGQALFMTGQVDRATHATREAIRRQPDDLRMRLNLVQMLRSSDRTDAAIAELDDAVTTGLRLEGGAGTEARPFRSATDYEQHMPITDQVDMALQLLAIVEMEAGRRDAAIATVDRLVQRPDPVTQAAGLARLGSWQAEQGDVDAAVRSYRDALQRQPDDTTRARLAELLVRSDQVDEARPLLWALADNDADPGAALTILEPLLLAAPEDRELRLLRGAAHFGAWHVQAARDDLRAVIALGDAPWKAHYWLGLSLVLFNPSDDPHPDPDFTAALDELVSACTVSGGDPSASAALCWLLDRYFGENDWLFAWAAATGADAPPPFVPVIDGLDAALLAIDEGAGCNNSRDWTGAADAFERAQAAFAACGFPVTAARLGALIADQRLRLYDLPAAAEQLDRAGEALFLTARPLNAELDRDRDEGSRRPYAAFEVDYLPVYGIGTNAHENALRQLRPVLLARSGDTDAAAADIGDLAWAFEEDGHTLAEGVSPSGLIVLGQILRAAGDTERSFDLLQNLAADVDGRDAVLVWATLATLAQSDRETWTECLDTAERCAGDDTRWRHDLQWMRAELELRGGSFARALELMRAAGANGREATDDRELLLLAEAHLGLEDAHEGLRLALVALERAEQRRATLPAWELRSAWAGAELHAHDVALRAALACGSAVVAFEVAERARARAFLDEAVATDPETIDLLDRLRHIEQAEDWLATLDGDAMAPADVARVHALAARLGVSGPPPGAGVGDVAAEAMFARRHAVAEVDARRLELAQAIGATPARWVDVTRLLPAGVVLAQYHIVDDRVVVFIGGHDDDAPHIVEPDVSLDAVLGVLRDAASDGFDARRLSPGRLDDVAGQLVAAIAEHAAPEDVLCIVPHGSLHALPFQVLEVGGVPLGLRNPVCFTPSTSILLLRLAQPPPSRPSTALVAGDPGGDLPYARLEARTVATQYGVDPLLGRAVTKPSLLERMTAVTSVPELVHIACHGYLRRNGSGEAGLVLGPRDDDSGGWLERTVLLSDELIRLRLRTPLVVLSACATGLSEVAPGDELNGLIRAFLVAGVGAAVVSQWSVDDLSTAVLMQAFNAALSTAPSCAHALRDAARAVQGLGADDLCELTRPAATLAREGGDRTAATLVEIDAARRTDQGPRLRRSLAASADPSDREAVLTMDARGWPAAGPVSDAPVDREHPFRHPHFWAPFVLVGDWRLAATEQ